MCWRIVSVCLAAGIAAVAADGPTSQPTTDPELQRKVMKLSNLSVLYQEVRLKELQEQHKSLRIARARTKSHDTKRNLTRQLQTMAASMRKIRAGGIDCVVPLDLWRPSVGDMGMIDEEIVIMQIDDDHNALVRAEYVGTRNEPVLWLSGIDFSKAVDGRSMRVQGLFEVTRTHRYATAAGGSNTVPFIQPLPISPAEVAPGSMDERLKKPRKRRSRP